MHFSMFELSIRITGVLIFSLFLIHVNAISEIPELSLKNLVTISSINDISSNWIVLGDTVYNEGRIILTPKPDHVANDESGIQFGSIWSTKDSPNLNAFTTELTIRSLGSFGYTEAGFSLFLIDQLSADYRQIDNNGGPSVFKGLQITLSMDNQLGPVIKAYLNDGKKLNFDTDYLGAYKYEYQSSNVPITIKLSYSNKFFKITCDNKLLFETDQINLSQLLSSSKLALGLTAKSKKNYQYHEQFEVLRLTTYDSTTKEMLENNDESLVARHQGDLAQEKPNLEKFLKQQEKLRGQLLSESTNMNSKSNDPIGKELQDIRDGLKAVISIIQSNDQSVLQQQVFGLSKSIDRLSSSFSSLHEQFTTLNVKYTELSNMFKRQFDLLDNYDSTLRSFDKVLQNQLTTSGNLESKLSTISSYYSNSINQRDNDSTSDESYGKLKSLLYMIFLPVVALLILVVLWVHRLRNDIKHAKVL
jgi:hypothetical protein